MAESRRAAAETVPRPPADPLRDDPFTLFAEYPTSAIERDAVVSLVPTADPAARLAQLRRLRMNAFADGLLASGEDRNAVLRRLAEQGPCAVSELLALFPEDQARRMHRTLGWLAKYGLVTIDTKAP